MVLNQSSARVENRHSIPVAGSRALVMDFLDISKILFSVRKRVKLIEI
jgi:hypothetical protein